MKTRPKRKQLSPVRPRGLRPSTMSLHTSMVERDYRSRSPTMTWSTKDDVFDELLVGHTRPVEQLKGDDSLGYESLDSGKSGTEEDLLFSSPKLQDLEVAKKKRMPKKALRKSVVVANSQPLRQFPAWGKKAAVRTVTAIMEDEEAEDPEQEAPSKVLCESPAHSNLVPENSHHDTSGDLFSSPEKDSFKEMNVTCRKLKPSTGIRGKENRRVTRSSIRDSIQYSPPVCHVTTGRRNKRKGKVESSLRSDLMEQSLIAEQTDSPQTMSSPVDFVPRDSVLAAVTSTPGESDNLWASSPVLRPLVRDSAIFARKNSVRSIAASVLYRTRFSVPDAKKCGLVSSKQRTEPVSSKVPGEHYAKAVPSMEDEEESCGATPVTVLHLTNHNMTNIDEAVRNLTLEDPISTSANKTIEPSSVTFGRGQYMRRSSVHPAELTALMRDSIVSCERSRSFSMSHSIRHSQSRRSSIIMNLSRPRVSSAGIPDDIALARKLANSRISPKEKVLALCKQVEVRDFDEFADKFLVGCRKLGEGVYGEVYLARDRVYKVIPIEGDFEVNGDMQKTFDGILAEIIVSRGLKVLSDPANKTNRSDNFCAMLECTVVRGEYPPLLIEAWEKFHDEKTSDNEHPSLFNEEQLYVVMEFVNGGRPLDGIGFKTVDVAESIFMQVAMSMAVAEKAMEFEHRDLHLGNVLVEPTDKASIDFILDGETYEIQSEGVKVNIIDFTLSRGISFGVTAFCDLSRDEGLFGQDSDDFQFQVYDLMRESNKNDWKLFNPTSNILWLKYLLLKLAEKLQALKPDFYDFMDFSENMTSAFDYMSTQI